VRVRDIDRYREQIVSHTFFSLLRSNEYGNGSHRFASHHIASHHIKSDTFQNHYTRHSLKYIPFRSDPTITRCLSDTLRTTMMDYFFRFIGFRTLARQNAIPNTQNPFHPSTNQPTNHRTNVLFVPQHQSHQLLSTTSSSCQHCCCSTPRAPPVDPATRRASRPARPSSTSSFPNSRNFPGPASPARSAGAAWTSRSASRSHWTNTGPGPTPTTSPSRENSWTSSNPSTGPLFTRRRKSPSSLCKTI
jgi:hypothetical protein